jgi:hypothetical protein
MTVATGKTVYKGAIVEIDTSTGHVQPATDTYICMGIAAEYGTAGEEIPIEFNHVEALTVASADETKNGAVVYASDDATIAYTGSNTIVGKQVGLVDDETINNGDTRVWVHICLNN